MEMKWIIGFAVSAILVTVAWLGIGALITNRFEVSDAGTFGDMFGNVNALFSGLAFAGVIVAILMQGDELRLQRRELTRSTKAQEAQEKALVVAARLNALGIFLSHHDEYGRVLYEEGGTDRPPTSADIIFEMHDLLAMIPSPSVRKIRSITPMSRE